MSHNYKEQTVRVEKLDDRAIIPTRAHDSDAGLDVYCIENLAIHANSDLLIRTGLSIAIPNGWVAIVKEKSGRAVKNKLTVGACVIDAGYRGELMIHLFNNQNLPVTMNAGEAIAQLVIVPCWIGHPMEVDDINEDTSRSTGGFGSTGLEAKVEELDERTKGQTMIGGITADDIPERINKHKPPSKTENKLSLILSRYHQGVCYCDLVSDIICECCLAADRRADRGISPGVKYKHDV